MKYCKELEIFIDTRNKIFQVVLFSILNPKQNIHYIIDVKTLKRSTLCGFITVIVQMSNYL